MKNLSSLTEALETVRKELEKAQNEIYNELKKQSDNIPIAGLYRGKRHGKKTALNDYLDYFWIEIKINNAIYWITLFYNDVDRHTGNFHTQLGRIQFWENINPKNKSPNQKCPGSQWIFCSKNSFDPKIWITDDNYSSQRVVQAFIHFFKNEKAIQKDEEYTMRKILFTNLLITVLTALLLAACGSNSASSETTNITASSIATEITNTTDSSNNTNESGTTNSGTTESASTELTTVTSELTTTESMVAVEDDRLENGMKKVHRVIEAYDAIMKNGYELNMVIQSDIEKLENDTFYLDGYYFADGKVVDREATVYSIGIEYYNNYVNNNGEHYNMAEWMSNQPNNESVRNKYFTEALGESYETNNKLLMEAIAVANYLKNCEYLEGLKIIETDEYMVNNTKSAYVIPLNCDGDTSLTAIFDEDNNLLQIWTPEGWNGYLFSF